MRNTCSIKLGTFQTLNGFSVARLGEFIVKLATMSSTEREQPVSRFTVEKMDFAAKLEYE